jgi:FHA domain-containing protein
MHLLIRAISLAGQPLTQAISAYFDDRGGTIGRSDTNTLALPDPERRISRLQAEVTRGPEGWRLLNVGNANPIWHNNRPLPPGEGALLDEGDELQIGTYALQVSCPQNDAAARTITGGRAAVDSRTVIAGSGAEPRTDAGRSAARVEVQVPAAPPPPAPTAPAAPAMPAPPSPMVAAPAAPVVPPPAASPFADLLGSSYGGAAPAGAPAGFGGSSSASPFADLLGPGASPSVPSAPSAFGSSKAPAPPASPAPSASPFDLFAAPAAGAAAAPAAPSAPAHLPDDFDPFADLQPVAVPASPARPAASSWDLPATPAAPAARDPFDFGSPSPASPAALPGDLDLLGAVTPAGSGTLDQAFGLGAASSSDPLADFMKKTGPAAREGQAAPASLDPLALLASREVVTDETVKVSAASLLPQADDVPELQAPMVLPQVSSPTALGPLADLGVTSETIPGVRIARPSMEAEVRLDVSVKPAPGVQLSAPPIETEVASPATFEQAPYVPSPLPVPSASALPASASAPAMPDLPAGPVDAQALWAAFCEGAGLRFVPPQGLNPELMRVIGQVLHHAIDGSLKLIAARAATKQEMRAEVTVIQARRNNPLKFTPDTQSALEQLLQPPLRGFMTGPEAIADAMDDLVGHTIGTMVGMRAALDGVLARFEPTQLEAQLVHQSMFDSLVPMNRRAKLWDLYLRHYESVRAEAQDDFHNLFGRAFLQAYEEQLDRLESERRRHTANAQPQSPA